MALVKFHTNEEHDQIIEMLRISRPNCKTGAAAVKYALEDYFPIYDSYNELKGLYDTLLTEHEQLKSALKVKQQAESQISAILKP